MINVPNLISAILIFAWGAPLLGFVLSFLHIYPLDTYRFFLAIALASVLTILLLIFYSDPDSNKSGKRR